MTKDLAPKEATPLQKDTLDVLVETCISMGSAITTFDPKNPGALAQSFGHIFKTVRGAKRLYDFIYEWKALREAQKIAQDYTSTAQNQDCLQELLESLDNDVSDTLRFEALRKIYLVAATETASDRKSLLPLQFIQIARTLSSGEILVLNANYRIAKVNLGSRPPHYSANEWLKDTVEKSGLGHQELVEIHETMLIDKGLLTQRRHGDRSGVVLSGTFRLTSLGFALCDYISSYDKIKPEYTND